MTVIQETDQAGTRNKKWIHYQFIGISLYSLSELGLLNSKCTICTTPSNALTSVSLVDGYYFPVSRVV